MDVFEVVATMEEPVCVVNPVVHLDGVLAFGAYLQLDEERRRALPPISSEWAEDFELPLARWEQEARVPEPFDERLCSRPGVVWGWKCSAARFEQALEGVHEVRKKPAQAEMLRYADAKKLKTGAGPVRARDRKFPTVFAREIRWCVEGDAERVLALARGVPGIGKLVGHGMGRVASWRAEEAREDWSMWRTLPDAESPLLYGIRAPYHHPSRQVFAKEPEGL